MGRSMSNRARRQELSELLLEALQIYMREQRSGLSRSYDLAKAVDYIPKRWNPHFTLFLDGRKSWLFCGFDRGGERAAAMYRPASATSFV